MEYILPLKVSLQKDRFDSRTPVAQYQGFGASRKTEAGEGRPCSLRRHRGHIWKLT